MYICIRGGDEGSTFHMAELSFSSLTAGCAGTPRDRLSGIIHNNTLPSLISIIAHHRRDQRSHHLPIHHSGLLKFFFTIRAQFFRSFFPSLFFLSFASSLVTGINSVPILIKYGRDGPSFLIDE